MKNGYLELFVWQKIPVRVHWSTLVLAAYMLGAGRRGPGLCLGILALLLLHEAGHALMCRRFRLRVLELRILPFGGECIHQATPSMQLRVLIAWGGVLAQIAAFLLVTVASGFRPFSIAPNTFAGAFVTPNLLAVAFNLLPIQPLDGFTAWRLKHLLRADREPVPTSSRRRRPRALSQAERAKIDHAIERAFVVARESTRASGENDA